MSKIYIKLNSIERSYAETTVPNTDGTLNEIHLSQLVIRYKNNITKLISSPHSSGENAPTSRRPPLSSLYV